jgi:hypothetical protein
MNWVSILQVEHSMGEMILDSTPETRDHNSGCMVIVSESSIIRFGFREISLYFSSASVKMT